MDIFLKKYYNTPTAFILDYGKYMKLLSLIVLVIISFTTKAKNAFEDFILESKTDVAGAPTLRLVLNEAYLITHTLTKSTARGKYAEDIVNFKNAA